MDSIRIFFMKMEEKSNGKAKLVKVTPERRPTAESLIKLEKEIQSQLNTSV